MHGYVGLARLLPALALVCAFTASAQTNCGGGTTTSPPGPCQFGEVSKVPASASYALDNNYFSPLAYVSSGSSGPFSAQWPLSLLSGPETNVPISFSAITSPAGPVPGAYTGSVSATYRAVYNNQIFKINVSVSAQWGNPVSGFINPKYVVMGVEYAPPGSKSMVTYTNDTVVGSSTTVFKSFKTDVNTNIKDTNGFSIFGFTDMQTTISSSDYNQEQDTSSTFQVKQETSNKTGVQGSALCTGLSHDDDLIYIWTNPILKFVTYTDIPSYVTWTGYGYDLNDKPAYPYMEIVPLKVAWLNGHEAMDSSTKQRLARTWAQKNVDGSGPGITSVDLANILKADKFADPTYKLMFNPPSITTTDGRFTACNNSLCTTTVPIAPGSIYSYSQATTTTAIQDQTAIFTYSEGYAVESQYKGSIWYVDLTGDMTKTTTFTWQSKFDQSTNQSQGQTAAFDILGPSCWSGPPSYDVYQDNLYGTFVFWPVK